MNAEKPPLFGKTVLVMGLGLNGGGVETVRYCARQGAAVVVSDAKPRAALAASFTALADTPFTFTRQDEYPLERVAAADILVKNPAVPPGHPWLAAARRVETDISLFLAASPARLTAVTGSKGKSTTSAAIHFTLAAARREGLLDGAAYLGGNIGRSPLSFVEELAGADDVTLELSSFQLGDLGRYARPGLLKPRCAVFTAIMPDHLDRYGGMEEYVADKRVLYRFQDGADAIIARDDEWGRRFSRESAARPLLYGAARPESFDGAWLAANGAGLCRRPSGETAEIAPPDPALPGAHHKMNLLAAGLALLERGLPPAFIRARLGAFPGIPHRLEFFCAYRGIRFYNDSAATIPQAAKAAVEAFTCPVILVAGGAGKKLDLTPLADAAAKARAAILLRGERAGGGTGTDALLPLLARRGVRAKGPFDTLEAALDACLEEARAGDAVVLSPGCASFDMFDNEFDRGDQWKAVVTRRGSAAP